MAKAKLKVTLQPPGDPGDAVLPCWADNSSYDLTPLLSAQLGETYLEYIRQVEALAASADPFGSIADQIAQIHAQLGEQVEQHLIHADMESRLQKTHEQLVEDRDLAAQALRELTDTRLSRLQYNYAAAERRFANLGEKARDLQGQVFAQHRLVARAAVQYLRWDPLPALAPKTRSTSQNPLTMQAVLGDLQAIQTSCALNSPIALPAQAPGDVAELDQEPLSLLFKMVRHNSGDLARLANDLQSTDNDLQAVIRELQDIGPAIKKTQQEIAALERSVAHFDALLAKTDRADPAGGVGAQAHFPALEAVKNHLDQAVARLRVLPPPVPMEWSSDAAETIDAFVRSFVSALEHFPGVPDLAYDFSPEGTFSLRQTTPELEFTEQRAVSLAGGIAIAALVACGGQMPLYFHLDDHDPPLALVLAALDQCAAVAGSRKTLKLQITTTQVVGDPPVLEHTIVENRYV
jgi:hypothetical protein